MLLMREALSHVSHSYDSSPVCITECWFMLLTREALSHISHSYDSSPVCIIECWFGLLTREAFSHVSNSYGFSPVCITECWLRLLTRPCYMYGFSLQCVFLIWFFNLSARGKALPHVSHSYRFSPVCILPCLFKSLLCEKALPHISHL